MKPTNLSGRAALVTGSAAGIGHAIALALAGQGCAVMLHGLEDPAQAQDALDSVQALGVPVSYHQVDLEDPRAIERLVGELSDSVCPSFFKLNLVLLSLH